MARMRANSRTSIKFNDLAMATQDNKILQAIQAKVVANILNDTRHLEVKKMILSSGSPEPEITNIVQDELMSYLNRPIMDSNPPVRKSLLLHPFYKLDQELQALVLDSEKDKEG